MQESSRAKIPQVDVKLELDDPPTREAIRKATMQLKVGKSPGIDGIPAEVYQHGGESVLDKLQDLFTSCLEKGTLPQDLSLAESLAPLLYEAPGIQDRRRSQPPVRCRDLDSLSETDQFSPTLLALHPWHQMARLRVERRSCLFS